MSEQVITYVAAGFGFVGCDRRDPDSCNCATWTPVICPICEKEIADGQEVIHVTRDIPYLAEDDPLQEYDHEIWHKACDPGSLAAEKLGVSGA